jgi:competence protein ComEA
VQIHHPAFSPPGARASFILLFALAVTAMIASGAQAKDTLLDEGPLPPAGVLNLNSATVDQLCWLPNIGPGKAARIVSHRERRPFKRVVELARVKGIGLKTVRKLRPWLTVGGPTTLTGPVGPPEKRPVRP